MVIQEYILSHQEEILADLISLASKEASTSDVEALNDVREEIKRIVQKRLNLNTNVIHTETGHDVLHVEYQKGKRPILLIGHYDTVHPIGKIPLIREGNKIKGPGVLDMKAGIIQAIWACKAMHDLNLDTYPIELLFNGDEEIGSPSSKEILKEKARKAKMAIILEPGVEDGSIKTGRKGGTGVDIEIFGKAAHAGNNPQDGRNAILAMALKIIALEKLNDNPYGTTVNVGVIEGGSKRNVVADYAKIKVDLRYKTIKEKERIIQAIKDIPCMLEGTKEIIHVSEGSNPLEETEENLKYFKLVQACALNYGVSLDHRFVGGASDGNRIAEVNIPLLDGMGAIGKGIHAPNEEIDIEQYLKRIMILISSIQVFIKNEKGS